MSPKILADSLLEECGLRDPKRTLRYALDLERSELGFVSMMGGIALWLAWMLVVTAVLGD